MNFKKLIKLCLTTAFCTFLLATAQGQSAYKGGEGDGHAMTEVKGVDFTTSIENNRQLQTNLYPNPTYSNQITLELDQSHSNIQYRIINLTGQTLMQGQKSHVQSFQLSLEGLASGSYTLLVRSGNQQHRSQFIKGKGID